MPSLRKMWLDLFLDPVFSDYFNFKSMSSINISGSSIIDERIRNIKKKEGLKTLTLDPISSEAFLVHSFT